MLKVIGLMGIVISSGLIGIMKACMLKERVNLLEDFLQMIMDIKSQINYFREPLPHIFAKIPKKENSTAYCLLKEVETCLKEKTAEIPKIWPLKAQETYKNTPVTQDDMSVINYISTFLGQTDYENHIVHFDYLQRKLTVQIEEAQRISVTKGTMYRKIGFFIGAIIAILFI